MSNTNEFFRELILFLCKKDQSRCLEVKDIKLISKILKLRYPISEEQLSDFKFNQKLYVAIKYLENQLKLNNGITQIDLRYKDIGAEGMRYLAEALKENSSITEINFSDSNIVAEGMRYLAEALRENTSITSINIGNNKIGAEGMRHLAEALSENTSITSINIGYNKIGAEGMRHLAEALKKNTSITNINLRYNGIGAEGMRYLAEALKENTSITNINLCCNGIVAEGMRYLAEALRENTSIKGIILSINYIDAEGMRYLAEALKENTSITKIDLCHNKIDDEGMRYLAEALKENTSIISIDLSENEIGAEGMRYLAEALKKNTSITSINIGYNKIGDEEMRYLAEALRENTSIKGILLYENGIGAEGMRHLAKALRENTSITEIYIGNNKIGDEGMRYLAEALKENKSITEIRVHGNDIGAEGMRYLAEALRENTSITNIDVGSNDIGDEGMRYLAEVLRENTSINHIEIEEIGDIGVREMRHLAEALSENTSITNILYDIDDKGINDSIRQIVSRNKKILDEAVIKLQKKLKPSNEQIEISEMEIQTLLSHRNKNNKIDFFYDKNKKNKIGYEVKDLQKFFVNSIIEDSNTIVLIDTPSKILKEIFTARDLLGVVLEYLHMPDVAKLVNTLHSRIIFFNNIEKFKQINFFPEINLDQTDLSSNLGMLTYRGQEFRIEDVPGDGNCFFHAVSLQTGMDHAHLREITANEILEHRSRYSDFISINGNEDFAQKSQSYFDNYSWNIATIGHWADHVAIHAMSNALGREINIYQNGRLITIHPDDGEGLSGQEPINVQYVNGNHFRALLTPESVSDNLIEITIPQDVEIANIVQEDNNIFLGLDDFNFGLGSLESLSGSR